MFCGENTCCVQRIQNIMLHILNIYNAVNQQHCVTLLVVSDSLGPHGLKLTRLLCPWNFPGKNTGVGCHSLLRDLLNPGVKPRSPTLQADSLPSEPPAKTIRQYYFKKKKKKKDLNTSIGENGQKS